jgi:hypothetical protein
MKKAGWIMSVLFALFMIVASAAPKLLDAQVAIEPMEKIGWSADYLLLIGIIELIGTILFVVPRTALLGAVLLTGLLGGALASNLRADSPLLSHTLFSVYLGVFMWAALWLRDANFRNVFPLARKTEG